MTKKSNKYSNSEYLSRDIFEHDFFHTFSKLYRFQAIFGISHFEARDLFISPLTLRHKIYTLVLSIIPLGIFSVCFYRYLNIFYPYPEVYFLANIFYITTLVNYINVVVNSRFILNKANVKHHLNLQKLDRLMGIERNKIISNILRNAVNMRLRILLVSFLTLLIFSFYGGPVMILAYIGRAWCSIPDISESTHCSMMIVYFMIRVRFLNSVLINHIEGKPSGKTLPKNVKSATKDVLRMLAAETHDYRYDNTDAYLEMLLECLAGLQEIFSMPVAVHMATCFCYIWQYVQFAMIGLKTNIFSIREWVILPTLLSNSLVRLLGLAIQFELLFKETRETKKLTIILMSRYFEGPLREKAKRMFKLLEKSPPRFSVYGMWDVGGNFIIDFCKSASTMVVTQLQFGLL